MVDISFLKKLEFPQLNLRSLFRSGSYVGIDIGSDSVKVVELKKDRERATLKTYGELKSARYFQKGTSIGTGGFIGYSDQSIIELLTDVLREANVTTHQAIFSIPATSSFLTVVKLPLMRLDEIAAVIGFEAKKYVPIPIQEVALDWQIIEEDQVGKRVVVLLAAVPQEVIEKYRRVAAALNMSLEAVEIESFSLVRSLLPADRGVSAIINWGAYVITLTIAEERRIRVNHNFGHGSREMTAALAQSLGVNHERAEALKKDIGLSEKLEERDIVDIITPLVDSILADIERTIVAFNRSYERKVEKIVLAGGGASLAGLVGHVAQRFGLETSIGNPFARTIYPPFLQPMIKEIAPNFAVAVGLALRQIVPA